MEGFSTRLRGLRKQRNLRQKDLAEVLGLAQTTIANYEQNMRFPDEATLKRIVDYFNTSFDYLLGRSGQVRAARAVTGYPQRTEPDVTQLTRLARIYLDSLIAGDKDSAIELAIGECEAGRTIEEIHAQILQPALEEIGRLWEVAEVDLYEEHFLSSTTDAVMARIMRYAPRPCKTMGTFLAVVSGGEQHELGLKMVSDQLELAGWKSLYLGIDVPSGNVIKAVGDRAADLLGISVTMQYNLNAAADLIAALRSSRICRNLRILVGGRALCGDPELFRRIGADAQAPSARMAVVEAERLFAGRWAR